MDVMFVMHKTLTFAFFVVWNTVNMLVSLAKRKVHSFTVKVPSVYICICQMFEFVFCKSNMFFQKSAEACACCCLFAVWSVM